MFPDVIIPSSVPLFAPFWRVCCAVAALTLVVIFTGFPSLNGELWVEAMPRHFRHLGRKFKSLATELRVTLFVPQA